MDPIDLATGLRHQQLTSLIDIAFRPVPAAINLRHDFAAQHGTPQVISIDIILALEPAHTIAIVSILRELRQVQRTHLLARRVVGVEVPLVLLQVAGRVIGESIALILPIPISYRIKRCSIKAKAVTRMRQTTT